jgi:NAD(P)H-dependent FMN reductase
MGLELKILVGSTRPGRAADLVLPWLIDRSAMHGAFAVDVLDLRDWPLPMFGETHEWRQLRCHPSALELDGGGG